MDDFNLQRFIDAQQNTYDSALKEIQNGRKSSHWMWFIFPQYKGLGRSSTAQKYAIRSRAEAEAYLEHPVLGQRLLEITNEVLNIKNKTAYQIFGSPDDLKLKSSMTLFDIIQDETPVFHQVLNQFYNGEKCKTTGQTLK